MAESVLCCPVPPGQGRVLLQSRPMGAFCPSFLPHMLELQLLQQKFGSGKRTICFYKTPDLSHAHTHVEKHCGWTSDSTVDSLGRWLSFSSSFLQSFRGQEWRRGAFPVLPSVLFFPATLTGPYLHLFFY